jgi:hypothetical protein
MTTHDGDKVLRRCPRCKLLFEAGASTAVSCSACGERVDGMALPVKAAVGPSVRRLREEDSTPREIHDHEPTEPCRRR